MRGKANAIAATVQAMDDDVEVILGGWLPDDTEGGRTGRPDILLGTSGGYLPGDVKGHRIVARRAKGTLSYSTLDDPSDILTANGFGAETTSRFDDYLQLAHYWRMLEAIGRAPQGPAEGLHHRQRPRRPT